jgi:putative FmdB family regulatory protein
MPLYEYHCSKCGKNFEKLQKFSDPPVKKHEGCGGKAERVLSAPAFQLKGSGWYATDYGKGGVKPASSDSASEKGSEKKTEAKSEGSASSETKSETKSDSKSESKSKSSKSKASTE